jgi:hypothetical protein
MEAPASPPSLDALPLRDPGGDWLAVIEASQGSRHKFKYKAAWRAFELSGVLPLGMSFPYDFGFLPSTLGDDGDPLDVLVLADEALPPGSVVPCRIVGVIEAEQQGRTQAEAQRPHPRRRPEGAPLSRVPDAARSRRQRAGRDRELLRRLQRAEGRSLQTARAARAGGCPRAAAHRRAALRAGAAGLDGEARDRPP